MLDPDDIAFINETSDRLLTDHTIPLIVVTIESMGHLTSQPMTIEQFASTLYNEWGIGYPQKRGEPWNKGILLLVSQDDRKARIELGAGYGHTKDAECTKIMQNEIVHRFKTMRFSSGIRSGVVALDEMARGTEGEEPIAWYLNPWFLGASVLFVVTMVWLGLTGKGGVAWVLRIAMYSGLGWLVYTREGKVGAALIILGAGFFEFMVTLNAFGWLGSGGRARGAVWIGDSGNSYTGRSFFGGFLGGSSGGGFSGGSFGGGCSGGGGATGSW
jgi:uncharacterized protein